MLHYQPRVRDDPLALAGHRVADNRGDLRQAVRWVSELWPPLAAADQCEGFQGRIRQRNFLLEGRGIAIFTPETRRFKIFRYRVSYATVADDGSVALGATLRRGRFFA